MFLIISTLIILIVFFGLLNRHNRKIHIPLMITAFTLDLSLVLSIEIRRQAIERVLVNHSSFVWFHVSVSILVLVLYIVLAWSGSKMSKITVKEDLDKAFVRHVHRAASIIFIVLRLTNYVTSFYMPASI